VALLHGGRNSLSIPKQGGRYALYMQSFTALAGVSLLLAASIAATAQSPAPRWPTNEDLRHLRAIRSVALSPDGGRALVGIAESTADGAATHFWLSSTDGHGAARQITFAQGEEKRGEADARWAPDGGSIWFTASRGGGKSLYRLSLQGGEAERMVLKVPPAVDDSKLPEAIPPAEGSVAEKKAESLALEPDGYAISHSGKWLAVWAADPETGGEKSAKEAKADARWVDHEHHVTRLYLFALDAEGKPSGKPRVAQLPGDVVEASWSPATDRLIALCEPPNGVSDLGPATTGWLVDAANPAQAQAVVGLPKSVSGAVIWSQDGGKIYFAAQSLDDTPPGFAEYYALNLTEQNPKVKRLMGGFAGQVAYGSNLEAGVRENLVSLVGYGTRSAVLKIKADGSGRPEVVESESPVVRQLTTNARESGWLWVAEGNGEAAHLCYGKLPGEGCLRLALPELESTSLRHAKGEVVKWKNGEMELEGLLYLPDTVKGTKLPLLLDVHGGPLGAWEDSDDGFVRFILGQGWAVFRPNPRGSSNYGAKFAAANKDDLGGGDLTDVMTGVDAVVSRYPIDATKLAMYGYSYGGEMAGFLEGKTDRFRAIISGAPVIDQFSEYGTEKGSWYDRWYFGMPWSRMAEAWRQSPLSGAGKAKTPFMLLQGEADLTDPLGQAQEMYRALRQQGVPVELVTYPREDHGPLSRGIHGDPVPEPWHGFDARKHIVDFINKNFGK